MSTLLDYPLALLVISLVLQWIERSAAGSRAETRLADEAVTVLNAR